MTTKTIVKSEKLKSGTNKSGVWILYKVTDSEGKTYTTFADFTPFLNQEAEVVVEDNKNGRPGDQNIRLIEKKPEVRESLAGEMLVELKAIRSLLADIKKNTDLPTIP